MVDIDRFIVLDSWESVVWLFWEIVVRIVWLIELFIVVRLLLGFCYYWNFFVIFCDWRF